ncbi:MAG: HAMP domain-containing histidine kinase [Anaerolineales bacterium]|nr:HAMP domain-containing histidine kinase [Anaerolineales bacterium]
MRSLATKLTLAFLLVGLTGAVLVAVIVQRRTRLAFTEFILNREQQILVNNLVFYYQANGSWDGLPQNLPDLLSAMPRLATGERDDDHDWAGLTLVGPDKIVIFSVLPGKVGDTISTSLLERGAALEMDGEIIGWLLVTPNTRELIPNSAEDIFLRTVNRASLTSALVAALLALVLGSFLALTLTRSLRELTDATVEIARGRFGKQVKVRSKDELGELAVSFNQMSLDLECATQARRQMTADIAHDLRSPLSVLSGYAEALSDGKLAGTSEIYDILHQETNHLSRLVEDLRLLSLADAGELPLLRQSISPQALLERTVTRHAVTAERHGIALRVMVESGLPDVNVDVERISQVLDNLILNAFRYTPAGGEIVLAGSRLAGDVRLQVRDNGSGIAPEDLPHIFDRFYRGDKARQESGESGLGLAIAKSIVEAHGGHISVESQPGQGAVFTITLQTPIDAAKSK